MLPTAPVTPISASPFSVAAVATGEEGINTKRKSRSYFLKSPASCAIHGIDCDITCAECRPMSRSAARHQSAGKISKASIGYANEKARTICPRLTAMVFSFRLRTTSDPAFALELRSDSFCQVLLRHLAERRQGKFFE